jgi:hypothetical protein
MSTTTQQNKAVIRRFFDAWNSRQPDAFDALIAPDVSAIAKQRRTSKLGVSIRSRKRLLCRFRGSTQSLKSHAGEIKSPRPIADRPWEMNTDGNRPAYPIRVGVVTHLH